MGVFVLTKTLSGQKRVVCIQSGWLPSLQQRQPGTVADIQGVRVIAVQRATNTPLPW